MKTGSGNSRCQSADLLLPDTDPAAQSGPSAGSRQVIAGPEVIGLAWISIWAFVRICSNPKLWKADQPETGELFQVVNSWLEAPNIVLVNPGARHWQIFRSLVLQSGATGNLISDASLAAIAIEHAATLASSDRDFGRFSGLRWVNPLD